MGSLRLHDVSLLKVGSVEPITAGADLIHSVFHLDCPSVSLVVRTHLDADRQPQYSYRPPCVAINPFHADQRVVRRLQMLRHLDAVKDARFGEMVAEMLAATRDLYTTYRVLEFLKCEVRYDSLFQSWLEVARNRHGEIVDRMDAAVGRHNRAKLLVARRALVRDPDQRFLLALLMNLRSQAEILRLVEQRCPGRDPKDMIIKWASEMSDVRVSGLEWNACSRAALGWLLKGLPVENVVTLLEQESECGKQAQELRTICTNLKESIVFGPLFHLAGGVA